MTERYLGVKQVAERLGITSGGRPRKHADG